MIAGIGAAIIGVTAPGFTGGARAEAAGILDGTSQSGWNFCDKCKGLFYGPEVSASVCPAGGNHYGGGSDDYDLLDGITI